MKRYLYPLFVFSLVASSCQEKDPIKSESVIPSIERELANRTELDTYIEEHFTKPYNVDLIYRYVDREVSREWTFVPISYDKSVEFATLIQHLYYEPFSKVTSQQFLREYTPKMVLLLGSYGYNSDGTTTLGLASNGVKVAFMGLNALDTKPLASTDEATRQKTLEFLNENYLRTLYHEGAHTFHQKIAYPQEYTKLSIKDYQYGRQFYYWKDIYEAEKKNKTTYQSKTPSFLYAGFITPYASTNPDEDFAELFSYCIMYSEADWEQVYKNADGKNNETDALTGKEILIKKREIIKKYVRATFGVDVEDLRKEVQSRYPNLKERDFTRLTTNSPKQ